MLLCCSLKCGLLRLFLTRGADVFLKNREGETPPDCCSHNSKAWAALQANRRERDAKNSRLSTEQNVLHRFEDFHAIPLEKIHSGDVVNDLGGKIKMQSICGLKAYHLAKHCSHYPRTVLCIRFS